MEPLKHVRVQRAIKEGVLDGLIPKRIIIKLEQQRLPIPSLKALYNKVAYIRRTLTKTIQNSIEIELRLELRPLVGAWTRMQHSLLGNTLNIM